MSTLIQWIEALASVASVIIAVVAIRKSDCAQKATSAMQSQLVQIEESREADRKKEQNRPRMVAMTDPGGGTLTIQNQGGAPAINVKVLIDDRPPTSWPNVLQFTGFPNEFKPGDQCRWNFTGHIIWHAEVRVQWLCEDGTPGELSRRVELHRMPRQGERT
ncbi:MAG: hypothetical protein ACYCUV_13060 [Phycisphaerae bacterium]